mmetsp:Transcript_7408/g.24438  ORF Transcript_7408/g.24438 Transcript_7408/m.24438 type:complete len:176 (-) Transcript_7408:1176-1703(-)
MKHDEVDLQRTDPQALYECLRPSGKFLCLKRGLSFPYMLVTYQCEADLILSLIKSHGRRKTERGKERIQVNYDFLAKDFNARTLKILASAPKKASSVTLKHPSHISATLTSRADEQTALGNRLEAVVALRQPAPPRRRRRRACRSCTSFGVRWNIGRDFCCRGPCFTGSASPTST